MALNDSATLNIGTGHLWLATSGTAAPADFRDPNPEDPNPLVWTEIGHTSQDDIISITSEGGETTVLGTLQSPSLRTSTAARTEAFTFNLAQWDEDSLKLYFGSNATIQNSGRADGLMAVPSKPVPTEKAFLAVYQDGSANFVIYAPKAEIVRADDMSLADTTSLATLPIKVTPLAMSGEDPYYVLPLGS